MATKQGTLLIADNFRAHAEWLNMTENDTGTSITMADTADRTVGAFGTFGAGTVIIEGSMDNVAFSQLHDYQGNLIALTDNTLKLLAENPRYVRPRSTAGSGMNLTIVIEGVR